MMCDTCDWQETKDKIQDILNTGTASESAVAFVEDVDGWIEENEHVTEAQSDRVESIADEVGA